jgi:hypothetical protein
MKVITVVNDREHLGFRLLRLSCNFKQLDLVVLVSKEKDFKSNRLKDDLLRQYLSGLPDPQEIVFFTDGNDAVMMAEEEEILSKFYRTGKDLVFSTETACWPDPDLRAHYPVNGDSAYRFLNSGGFIGRAGLIRDLLDDHTFDTPRFGVSNQYLWARKYLNYPGKIHLDTGCELFHTFSPEVGNEYIPKETVNPDYRQYYAFMKKWFRTNFHIRKDRIYSNITGTWPCQAHFNGVSKVLLDSDMIDMILAMGTEYRPARFIYETDDSQA